MCVYACEYICVCTFLCPWRYVWGLVYLSMFLWVACVVCPCIYIVYICVQSHHKSIKVLYVCAHVCAHMSASYNLVPGERRIRPWARGSYYTVLYILHVIPTSLASHHGTFHIWVIVLYVLLYNTYIIHKQIYIHTKSSLLITLALYFRHLCSSKE